MEQLSKEEVCERLVLYFSEEIPREEIYEAMDIYAKQVAIGFAEWMQYDYGWGNLAGKYYSYADTDVEYDAEELFEMYLQSLNK